MTWRRKAEDSDESEAAPNNRRINTTDLAIGSLETLSTGLRSATDDLRDLVEEIRRELGAQ